MTLQKEIREIYFDKQLNIEAYYFKGIKQKFPNHFHDYYVIGFIENGKRYLCCKNKEYIIKSGDLLLLNPYDNHSCADVDSKTLEYCCINIPIKIMKKIYFAITGINIAPEFTQQVLFDNDIIFALKELHSMIMNNEKSLKKESILFSLISKLIYSYTDSASNIYLKDIKLEVKKVCDFLEINFGKNIKLDDLSKLTGLSKYYLLRSFTKEKGISPYSYFENIRINKARKLLEKGIYPLNVALEIGFVDQSHFSNCFKKFIGLTPKQYMKIFL